MVFNATFYNISVISWQSVLLMVSTRRKTQTCHKSLEILSHKVPDTPRHEQDSNSQRLCECRLNAWARWAVTRGHRL